MEDMRSADRYLVGRPEGRRLFGRPRRKWEDNIKGGSTLVTLPGIVTPYRDSVDGTCARVTYQKMVTR